MTRPFDRNSNDAVIQDILTQMAADRATMARNHADNLGVMQDIRDQVTRTNGRVTALEKWKAYVVGGTAVIVALIGWIVTLKSGH